MQTLSTSFGPNLIGAPFGTVVAAGFSMERIVSGLRPLILCIVTQGIPSLAMFRTRRRSVSSRCRKPFAIADDNVCAMLATNARAESYHLCRKPFAIADDSVCAMLATNARAEDYRLEPCEGGVVD